MMRGVLVLLVLLVLCGLSVAWALLRPLPPPPLPSMTVEVLNGCGAVGLAGQAADALRALGQDVVATGNAARSDFGRSVLVDRRGRPWLARRLAERIGPVLVVLEQDDSATSDLLLILGTDHPKLSLFARHPRRGRLRLPKWLSKATSPKQVLALPPSSAKCYLAGDFVCS